MTTYKTLDSNGKEFEFTMTKPRIFHDDYPISDEDCRCESSFRMTITTENSDTRFSALLTNGKLDRNWMRTSQFELCKLFFPNGGYYDCEDQTLRRKFPNLYNDLYDALEAGLEKVKSMERELDALALEYGYKPRGE